MSRATGDGVDWEAQPMKGTETWYAVYEENDRQQDVPMMIFRTRIMAQLVLAAVMFDHAKEFVVKRRRYTITECFDEQRER